MNIFSELKIGDNLDIEVKDEYIAQYENNILNAQLVDIDDNYLYILPPVYKGKRYTLHKNQDINMSFYRKKGIYQFNAHVINKIDNNVIIYVIKPVGEVSKIQRRNYYRLPIVITAILKNKKNDKIIEIKCSTKDLSGGGVKVLCKNEIENFENVTIDIYTDDNKPITMHGQVVRVLKDEDNNTYEIGIEFKNASEINTDKIFAFIFKKQRLLRKKGMI